MRMDGGSGALPAVTGITHLQGISAVNTAFEDKDLRPEREAAPLADRAQLDPDTRLRIEQAVLDIFSEREFHRVGLIEVARGANVSLQTIYKYYGSKEALLFSSLDTWMGKLAVRMIDHLQGIEDYKERFRKVFWVSLDFFERNPKVMQ